MKQHGAQFNYSKINSYIYLGSNACCYYHFDKELLAKGIKANIGLEAEKQDQPQGVDFHLWLPTVDHQAPTAKQLEVGTAFIEELIANRIKVYVHCRYGHGRSPTLVIAYFISRGMSWQAAYDYVKARRPEIHLTKAQLTALKKFAKTRR